MENQVFLGLIVLIISVLAILMLGRRVKSRKWEKGGSLFYFFRARTLSELPSQSDLSGQVYYVSQGFLLRSSLENFVENFLTKAHFRPNVWIGEARSLGFHSYFIGFSDREKMLWWIKRLEHRDEYTCAILVSSLGNEEVYLEAPTCLTKDKRLWWLLAELIRITDTYPSVAHYELGENPVPTNLPNSSFHADQPALSHVS